MTALHCAGDAEQRKQRYPKGDRLKQLRAFCQCARLGSVSRAAERLGLSQPSVSVQVRTLEEELGLSLFDRRGSLGLTLTPVGERLFKLALPLVHGMDHFPDTFAEKHHGVFADIVRIGVGELSGARLLPPYLKRFQRQHPGIRIEVRIGSGRERLRWLRDYEIDLAVAAGDTPWPELSFHPILASETMLITPEDHPLAGRTSITLEEVVPYPVVGHARTSLIRQVMDVVLRLEGLSPDVVVEVDGWDIITECVAAGIGIAFVPDLCLNTHDRLWRIPLGGVIPPREYGAVTRQDGLISLGAGHLLRTLAPDGPQTRGAS